MKKIKRLVAALAVAVMALGLVACGSSSKGPDVSGKYDLYAIESEGLCIKAEGFISGGIELTSDGKGTLTLDTDSTDITYKANGDVITLTADGDDQDVTLKDGVITLDIDGSIAYFAKEGADTSKIEALTFEEALAKLLEEE